MAAGEKLLGRHRRSRALLHRRLRPLGRAARHRAPDGSDASDPGKLSTVSLLLPAKERAAADLPHTTLAADAGVPVVPLAGAQSSHPVQPGLRPGHAAHGEAHPAHHLLGRGDRARPAGARHQYTAGPARPRHAGDVLLDGHPAQGTHPAQAVRCGPRTRHADDPPGQGQEGPHDPDRRAGAGVGGKISARSPPAVSHGAGRRHAFSYTVRRAVPSRRAELSGTELHRSGEPWKIRLLPYVPAHHGDSDARRRRRSSLHPAGARARRTEQHGNLHARGHPQTAKNPRGHTSRRHAGAQSIGCHERKYRPGRRGTEGRVAGHARRGSGRRIRIDRRGARRRQKAASVERSAGRLVKFEAVSDNERVIGCATRSVLRAPRSTRLFKIPTQVHLSARKIGVMLTAAKEEILSAPMVWTDECVFPLAADPASKKHASGRERRVNRKLMSGVFGEKTLHCFSATAPLSGNSRRGWENSSGKTTAGSALDSNGNTLTKVVGSNTTSYAWDFENRMTSVTPPGTGGTVSFKYDPFGRRIYKASSAGTSIFAYDGDNLIEETNAIGGVVARYSQTQNIDEPLAMLRSGATSFYHADGLGSVTSLSNSAGALAQTYAYDSFGKQTSSSGSLTNAFLYTGREFESETGLYFYRARYYDQNVGRFISEDPARLSGDGPNFYAYAQNRPTLLVDPGGLLAEIYCERLGSGGSTWWQHILLFSIQAMHCYLRVVCNGKDETFEITGPFVNNKATPHNDPFSPKRGGRKFPVHPPSGLKCC